VKQNEIRVCRANPVGSVKVSKEGSKRPSVSRNCNRGRQMFCTPNRYKIDGYGMLSVGAATQAKDQEDSSHE
jgi:hypothetical protein